MPIRVGDLGTILSVWAHPDDETYLAGALMAEAIASGQRVVCVSLTAGELGTNDPITWPPARLARLRRWEAAASMAVLGVTDHRVLDLPDGGLADVEPTEGVALVHRLMQETVPDTIVTFAPDGMTFHRDHVTVSQWVTAAWEEAGRPARLLHATATDDHLRRFGALYEAWGSYMTDQRPTGTPVADLAVHLVAEGPALDQKLAALAAMASQTSDVMATHGPHYAAMVAEEAFVEWSG